MKVTMLGISGSGKTSFMAAMYESLGGGGVEGFTIVPRMSTASERQELEDALIAEGEFARIAFSNNDLEFPDGTTKTTIWKFDLFHADNIVTTFEWLDYRGGYISDIFLETDESKREEIKKIIYHIKHSDAILVIADSFNVTHFKTEEARFRSGARDIGRIFEQLSRYYKGENITVLIAITKVDRLSMEWKENGYHKLFERVEQVFSHLIQISQRNPNWVLGVIPVSAVGEGNTKTSIEEEPAPNPPTIKDQITSFPVPSNIAEAIFFCLGTVLERTKQAALKTREEREQEIEDTIKSLTIKNYIWALIKGKKTPYEAVKELLEEDDKDKRMLAQFAPYIKPLYNLSRKVVRILR